MAKTVKLIFVEADANRNKWYHMKELPDGSWEASWGRVGNAGEKQIYEAKLWDKKYKEKTKKGYVDQTHLFAESSSGDSDNGWQITNNEIKKFIEQLQSYAKGAVTTNYIVTSDQVTQKQVDEAQAIIDDIVKYAKLNADVKALNERLVDLYKVIPRKMKKVADHLVQGIKNKGQLEEVQRKIKEEQDLLDVMAGQVNLSGQKKTHKKGLTLADMGLTVENVTDAEIAKIKKMMGAESGKFRKAYRVHNTKTQAAFDEQVARATNKYTELLWHGSRNENWWSIATTGLRIRPAGSIHTGSAFGDGIYGANKAQKSIGYTSLDGSYWARGGSQKAYLALYNFHLGKQYITYQGDSNLSAKKLKDKGNFDSTYAKAADGTRGGWLRNDEFIVYNSEQTTICFLIEISNGR